MVNANYYVYKREIHRDSYSKEHILSFRAQIFRQLLNNKAEPLALELMGLKEFQETMPKQLQPSGTSSGRKESSTTASCGQNSV
jgi:hypothetical protein